MPENGRMPTRSGLLCCAVCVVGWQRLRPQILSAYKKRLNTGDCTLCAMASCVLSDIPSDTSQHGRPFFSVGLAHGVICTGREEEAFLRV